MSESKQSEQNIERLLHAAGKRQEPPQDVRDRVYANTLAAWQALPQSTTTPEPKKARWYPARLALAASVLLAAVLGVYLADTQQAGTLTPAQVVYVEGGYMLDGLQHQEAASKLMIGSTIFTQPGAALSLRFAGGALVTLDQGTRVTIKADEKLGLAHGRVYIDAAGQAASLGVSTPFAEIVDIGTQYLVAFDEAADEVVVAVREGQVQITSAAQDLTASAAGGVGESLKLDQAALIERTPIAAHDAYWDWRKAGRAPYVLHGSTVHAYLSWLARDAGFELRFASNAVEQMSKISVLRGRGNSDDTAIDDALAATRFALERLPGSRWVIDFRS